MTTAAPVNTAAPDPVNALANFPLHEKQGMCFLSPATEILYGGAAGGGKSYLMRAAAIFWCCAIPGLQVYLFRRHFGDLLTNHMEGPRSFHVMLEPLRQAGRVKIIKQVIKFDNGSRIYLRHLQHEKNVYGFLGAEIHLLMFDELTTFTEKMYTFLRGRCRLGALKVPDEYKGLFPRIINGSNPGNIGHHWVKKYFVDKPESKDSEDYRYVLRTMRKEDGGMLRQYIPAVMTDNPTLVDNDPDYINKLEGLGDPALVEAMKNGDWNIIAGAMFGSVWRKHLHVRAPFDIPSHWKIWRSADDGFANPAVTVWMAQNPRTETIYVVKELHKCMMMPEDFAREVIRIDRELKVVDVDLNGNPLTPRYLDMILEGYIDSSAFDNTGSSPITRGKQMNNLGCRWKPVPKWPGSRIAGIQEFFRRLSINHKDPERKAGIQFFSNCVNCIRTIPALPRHATDVEDIMDDADDHDFDAVRYALQWRFPKFAITKFTT